MKDIIVEILINVITLIIVFVLVIEYVKHREEK